MNKFKKYRPLVVKWAKEKGILEKATPSKQLLKTYEEIGELLSALEDQDLAEITDAIGDIIVTLIIYSEMKGVDYSIFEDVHLTTHSDFILHRLVSKWSYLYTLEILNEEEDENEITRRQREGYMKDIIIYLNEIAHSKELHIWDCLESAYNVIKDRKGKMIKGQFVKA